MDVVIELQQYRAVREQAAIARLPARTLIDVRGDDRSTFLHNLCTNDISALKKGQGCEAFFTNVQGKILGHVFVFCQDESLVIETVPGQADELLAHLDRYLIREDVVLTDRSTEWAQVLLAGPDSRQVLDRLDIEAPAEMLGHREVEVAGKPAHIRRVPWLSVQCYSIQLLATDIEVALPRMTESGAVVIDDGVFDICRIESGFPFYGRDISVNNLPQEVGRDAQAICFTKGCYLGQETVARIDALGHVNRRLVGLQFTQDATPSVHTELLHDGKVVGEVTSVAMSPRLETAVALGYVRREVAKSGSGIDSPLGGAKVVDLPQ